MYGSRKSTNAAFILIELLVVIAILAMVATAIFGTMAAGLKIWKRVTSTSYLNEVSFGWEELQKDLNNQVTFKAVGFVGKEKEVLFPVLVPFQDEIKKDFSEIGVVRYYFDAEKCHCLCRQKSGYGEWLENKEKPCKPIISSVKEISFEYFGNGEGSEALASWQPSWPYTVYPMALRLKVSFDKNNEKTFTSLIPMGM